LFYGANSSGDYLIDKRVESYFLLIARSFFIVINEGRHKNVSK